MIGELIICALLVLCIALVIRLEHWKRLAVERKHLLDRLHEHAQTKESGTNRA